MYRDSWMDHGGSGTHPDCNLLSSTGYGQEFARLIIARFGIHFNETPHIRAIGLSNPNYYHLSQRCPLQIATYDVRMLTGG
jgi:hypothetical protein